MNPRRIDVRPCSEADLDRLRADWPTSGSDIHGEHHSAQQSGRATYLVAWRGSTPMGSGMVQWTGCMGSNARSAHPDCIEINHLQVRTGLRGQGAGSALIAAAEAIIRSRDHTEAGVGVSPANHDAARLYRRLGYEATGVYDTCSYTWIDAGGVSPDVTEQDELLVKWLRPT